MVKNKIMIGVVILIIAVISVGSFVSFSKFGVFNPFSTANGLFQIVFSEKEYIEIQAYPKVIVAKPNVSLEDYMQKKGLEEDVENQLGALRRFHNNDMAQYILYSTNHYFSKWRWQE